MADVGGVSSGQLKSIIERVERLEEEKAGIGADIKEIFAEAKANGFDTKAIRQVLRLRKMDRQAIEEMEEMVNLYCQAIGMVGVSGGGDKKQMRVRSLEEEMEMA